MKFRHLQFHVRDAEGLGNPFLDKSVNGSLNGIATHINPLDPALGKWLSDHPMSFAAGDVNLQRLGNKALFLESFRQLQIGYRSVLKTQHFKFLVNHQWLQIDTHS